MPDMPQTAKNDPAGEPARGVRLSGVPERAIAHDGTLPVGLGDLVGRERKTAELGRLLSEHRLLTLTGPGGAGKTRLALAAAHEVAPGYEGGAWWVELAPVSESDLVPQAVARALSVPERPGRSPTEDLIDDLGSWGSCFSWTTASTSSKPALR